MAAKSATPDVPSTVLLRVPNAGGGDPDSRDLAEFMMLLRAAYVAAAEVGDGEQALDDYLAKLTASKLTALLNTSKPRIPLRTRRISHDSPLEILFYGGVYALVAGFFRCGAELVSGIVRGGGKIKLGGSVKAPWGFEMSGEITAELPTPLAEASRKLRVVLSQGSGAQITYGAGPRTVTLTKAQFDELMKHPRSKKGTFQRRLASWQARVNKTTRKLVLYPDDIDFIRKHGSQAKKGGWQRSIRTIFDTHVPWL